jgi:hypothetical protein
MARLLHQEEDCLRQASVPVAGLATHLSLGSRRVPHISVTKACPKSLFLLANPFLDSYLLLPGSVRKQIRIPLRQVLDMRARVFGAGRADFNLLFNCAFADAAIWVPASSTTTSARID